MAEAENILDGCCVYLWQRVDGDGLSLEGITAKVKDLGGKVASKLTKDVTHIIFQRALGASAKELLAEDEDLRFIYRKVERSSGQLVVVSPLWLQSCETAKRRKKEARYIVPEPKKPIFLDHIETGENKRKGRKSFAARPRELVEVPDVDDPLFSSSQQIRDLNAVPDCQVGISRTFRGPLAPPLLSDVEENDGKRRPSKLQNAGSSFGISTWRQKTSSEKRIGVVQPQQPAGKRGMRQLSLNFLVLPKIPRTSPAEFNVASLASQQPAVDHNVPEQRAKEKAVAEAMAVIAGNSGTQKKAPSEPNDSNPLTVVAAHQQQLEHHLTSKTGTPEPPTKYGQGAPATAASPRAAVGSGSAEPRSLVQPSQPDKPGNSSFVGHPHMAPASTAAAGEGYVKPAILMGAPMANASLPSALPLQVPMSRTYDRSFTGDGGSADADAVATEVVTTLDAVGSPTAGLVLNKTGEGPPAKAPILDAKPVPPGSRTTSRGSKRRGSRSLMGTPLTAGLMQSMARATPLTTPKGLTPIDLVVPRLKSQDNRAPAAAALGALPGPSKSPAAGLDADPSEEMDGQAAGSCVAAMVMAEKVGTLLASIHPSGLDTPGGPGQDTPATGVRASAGPAVPASTRRSARVRWMVQPTPPPAMNICLQGTPQGSKNVTGGGAELGNMTSAADYGSMQSCPCPARRASALCGVEATEAVREAPFGGPRDDSATAGRGDGRSDTGFRGDLDGAAERRRGSGYTSATCRRSQRKTRGTPLKPLPLSPVIRDDAPGRGSVGEAISAAGPTPAGERGQPHNADDSVLVGGEKAATNFSAEPYGALTPGSVLRRSARLADRPALRGSALRDQRPSNRPGLVPGQGFAAEPMGSGQEREQGLHDSEWHGFKISAEQPSYNPTPLSRGREIARLVQDAALAVAPLPEDRAVAAAWTPATASKARRRNRSSYGEDVGKHAMEQLPTASMSFQKPVRLCPESTHKAPVDLALAAPSPAICTQSHTCTAAATPGVEPAAGMQSHRRQLKVSSQPYPVDEGRIERRHHGMAEPLPQPKPEEQRSVPDSNPSPNGRAAGEPGPSSTTREALRQPLGIMARSCASRGLSTRRRALELELAGVVQAPHSKDANDGRAGAIRTDALEAITTMPSGTTVQDVCAVGSNARPDELQPRQPTTAGPANPLDAAPTPLLPRSPRAARHNSVNTGCPNAPMQLICAAAAPAALRKEIMADGAAQPNSGFTGAAASHTSCGPKPAAAMPNSATAVGMVGLSVIAPVGNRIPPLPPKTTTRKRPREASPVKFPVREEGSGGSNGILEARTEMCRGQHIPPTGTSPAEEGDGSAQTDSGSVREDSDAALLRGVLPTSTSVAGTMTADPVADAARQGVVTRSAAGPAKRSRLRLLKQEAAAPLLTEDSVPLVQLDHGELQGAIMLGPTAMFACTQLVAKRRKTLSTSGTADQAACIAATAVPDPPAPNLTQGDGNRPVAGPPLAGESKDAPGGSDQPNGEPGSGNDKERRAAASMMFRGATYKRNLVVRGMPRSAATAIMPLNAQRGIIRSKAFLMMTTGPGAGACRQASGCLSTGGGGKLNRHASPAAAADAVTSLDAADPSRTSSADAPSASLGPALGQYPRGKEHPMRAGYRYLASTQIGDETRATIERAVKSLNGARQCTPGYEDGHITHLVVGDATIRTVKVLLGIANGAIFVAPSWVEASLAAGEWVSEEQHLVQGSFAAAATAVRACLQAQQQQLSISTGAAAAAAGSASQAAGRFAGVVSNPLAGKMVAVYNSQCNGPRMGNVQKKKTEVETIVKALGGRLGPFRSANLVIVLRGSASPQVCRQSMAMASEEWLLRLAETHIWQEPSLAFGTTA